jgi:hypothetical protein
MNKSKPENMHYNGLSKGQNILKGTTKGVECQKLS